MLSYIFYHVLLRGERGELLRPELQRIGERGIGDDRLEECQHGTVVVIEVGPFDESLCEVCPAGDLNERDQFEGHRRRALRTLYGARR